MDAAYVGSLSALCGSLVGGAASFASAWITQTSQNKRELIAAELTKREALYGEFVAECSKLLIDGLEHTLERPDTMLHAFSLLNRIRLTASPEVLAIGEQTLNIIIRNYSRDKLAMAELFTRLRDGTFDFPDPIKDFSSACRLELQELRPRR